MRLHAGPRSLAISTTAPSRSTRNAAERALRVIALGRKNYLFAGSNRGGERAAAIYSLLGTAKLNVINPERYLKHVLTHIADHPINRIADLLPWNLPSTHTTGIATDA
jgi:transposase